MANSDPSRSVFQSGAGPLSRIMHLDEAVSTEWNEADLAAMLRHQLAAPLAFDLAAPALPNVDRPLRDQALQAAKKMGIKSFRDLLTQPKPPLELLKLVKDLFKHHAGASSKRRPEQEVAYLMYLLTILVARTRLGCEITQLTKTDLRRGYEWAASRPWVDDENKALFASGASHLP
jgi:hypothetical protein